MTGRDIEAALSDTTFYIQMMEKLGPAIRTLENVSELHQFFRGGCICTAAVCVTDAYITVDKHAQDYHGIECLAEHNCARDPGTRDRSLAMR